MRKADGESRMFSGVAAILPPEIPARLLFFNLIGLSLGGLAVLTLSSVFQPRFDFWHAGLQGLIAVHLLAAAAGLAHNLSIHLRAAALALLCYAWAAIVMVYLGSTGVVALFLVCTILVAGFLYGVWGLVVAFSLALSLWVGVAYLWITHQVPPHGDAAPAPDTVARWVQGGLAFSVGTLAICGLVHILFRRTAQHFAEEARLRDSLAQERTLRAEAEIVKLRAELAQREAERTLAMLFKVAPIGMALIKDRKVLLANQWLCDFFGRTAEDIEGRSSEEIYVSAEEFHRVGLEFERALAGGRVAAIEAQVIDGKGATRWVLLNASVADEVAHDGRFIVTISDISAMKHAEATIRESESRLAEIFDHTSDIIFSVAVEPGPRFRLERVNRAAEAYGLSAERITRDDLTPGALLPPRLAARAEEHFRRVVASVVSRK